MPTWKAYVATKSAVEQLTRAMAKGAGSAQNYHQRRFTRPHRNRIVRRGQIPEQIQRFARLSAFGWLGHPREIGEVVTFLANDAAHWIRGRNIRVNGGLA